MALLVLPAGCCIAPLLATRNELVGGVAPPGMRTEAYTWPITSFVGGIAAGAALCGALVEGPGWRTAFLIAAAITATGASRRRRPPHARSRAGVNTVLQAVGLFVVTNLDDLALLGAARGERRDASAASSPASTSPGR